MKILVTGAAGFIGSHVCRRLINSGHTVIGLDSFDLFYPRKFKILNIKKIRSSERFKFYEANIKDKKILGVIFNAYKVDLVIHLAAKAGIHPSIEFIADYYDVNLKGTVSLLECMKAFNVTKMLFASSSSVYGKNTKVPFSEEDNVDNPISPYASTKKSGELLCHVYSHLYGFDITCLRFFTVFGPGQRPDLAIHKFTRLIDQDLAIPFYGDGSSARDYTYIDDIVDGVECALKHLSGFNIYNLGESRIVTLNELIHALESVMGKKANIRLLPFQAGDVQITQADISKARKEIGYNPKYDLMTGLNDFYTWYVSNKDFLYPDKANSVRYLSGARSV